MELKLGPKSLISTVFGICIIFTAANWQASQIVFVKPLDRISEKISSMSKRMVSIETSIMVFDVREKNHEDAMDEMKRDMLVMKDEFKDLEELIRDLHKGG